MVDPEAELTSSAGTTTRPVRVAPVIRKCMGEFEENPETTRTACQLPVWDLEALGST
jgi:hypothetical protein